MWHRARHLPLSSLSIHPERRWGSYPGQGLPPVGLGFLTLLRGQPTDVVAIGTALFMDQPLSLHFCIITGQHLLREPGHTPAIKQEVVMRPDHLDTCLGEAYEGQTYQRDPSHIKPQSAIALQERLQVSFLLLLGVAPPIQHANRQGHLAVDHLQWFTQFLPDDGRAQDRMSRDDLLPCSLKGPYG